MIGERNCPKYSRALKRAIAEVNFSLSMIKGIWEFNRGTNIPKPTPRTINPNTTVRILFVKLKLKNPRKNIPDAAYFVYIRNFLIMEKSTKPVIKADKFWSDISNPMKDVGTRNDQYHNK